MRTFVALIVPVLMAGSAASAAALPKPACIRAGEIAKYALAGDGRTLYLHVNGRGTFRLTMRNQCLDGATRRNAVEFRLPSVFARACAPGDLQVSVHNDGVRDCALEDLQLMPPGQVAALPRSARP